MKASDNSNDFGPAREQLRGGYYDQKSMTPTSGPILFRTSDGEYARLFDTVWVYSKRNPDVIDRILLNQECYVQGMIENMTKGTYLYFINEYAANQHMNRHKVLLTTYDGEKLKHNDHYYTVFTKKSIDHKYNLFSVAGPFILYATDNIKQMSTDCEYFASKTAAEAFIDDNKVLLKTEDGKELKQNDQYWYVSLGSSSAIYIDSRWKVGGPYSVKKSPYDWDYEGTKFFSTKEAAEQYVDMNKSTISKAQIIKAMKIPADVLDQNGNYWFRMDNIHSWLKQLFNI